MIHSVTEKQPDQSAGPVEKAVLFHVGILLVFSTWAFGGNAAWSHRVILAWTLIAPLLTAWHIRRADSPAREAKRIAALLWPWLLLAFFVIASCFNPTFRPVHYAGETFMAHEGPRYAWLPGTANPEHTIDTWWFFAGIYLSCFNLLLTAKHRRYLRALLAVAVINTILLAVFGTLQKLTGAKGLYFDLQPSPQPAFFASFIYHNHWGAHAVLITGALLGLIFYFSKSAQGRDFFHSPAFGGVLATLAIAASIPLSSSRSCTILIAIFIGIAVLHGIVQLFLRAARHQTSAFPRIGALVVSVAVFSAGIYYLGKPVIDQRVDNTVSQLDAMRAAGSIGSRAALYRDTWAMAREEPWFGWGMGSYSIVFQPLFNRQKSVDRLPLIYLDAHSDWLQSLAELGFAGTLLIGLTGLLPLSRLPWRQWKQPLIAYLLGGCGIVLLYAWLEFPFGNGAVVIAFWTCFFTAIQYGRLQARMTVSSSP